MGTGIGAGAGTHIVWDWNGTLFHDIDVVIEATNASFAEIGLASITLARYRELYCVPIPRFYERLIGRLPTEAEWTVMDEAFHRHYWARAEDAGLAAGAAQLLTDWQESGLTQSLCSLAPHAQLIPIVRTHGIERRFLRVGLGQGGAHGAPSRRAGGRRPRPGRGDRGRRRRRGGGRVRGSAGRALHRGVAQQGQSGDRRGAGGGFTGGGRTDGA
jgi:hypothetical protein